MDRLVDLVLCPRLLGREGPVEPQSAALVRSLLEDSCSAIAVLLSRG